MPNRIIAIGDIHGDLESLIYALHTANLIDDNGDWCAYDTILVQTGDIIDDCRKYKGSTKCINKFGDGGEELIIYAYLTDLNSQAINYGSKILICLGNHELVATINNRFERRYTQLSTKKIYNKNRETLFSPSGEMAKKLACIVSITHLVGDWIFLHGGITSKNIEKIGQIEYDLKLYLKGELDNPKKFIKTINNKYSPIWDRTFSSNDDVCHLYDIITKAYNSPNLKMVIGHTVQNSGITSICEKGGMPRIYRIDTGMSQAFGSKEKIGERIEMLEILKNGTINILKCKN